jgi:hypothetical protein
LNGGTIHIEGVFADHRELSFAGTLTLTNQARCKLNVNGEALDEWQVLRKALEPLFFGN